jgi:hypothetical protein
MKKISKVLTFLAPALFLSAASSFAQSGPYQYHPVSPCRLADTRVSGGAIANNGDRAFKVQNLCAIPVGAAAVSLNVTAVNSSTAGYLTLYPAGVAKPLVSTVNFKGGEIVANGAIVPVGAFGSFPNADLRVFAGLAGGSVHVVLDVTGYFQ